MRLGSASRGSFRRSSTGSTQGRGFSAVGAFRTARASRTGPSRRLSDKALDITADDTPDDARARIEVVAADAPDAEVVAHHVSSVLGLSTAVVAPEDADWAIRGLLSALAAIGPLVLVLDDIHWAEPAMLALIGQLEEGVTEVPLFAVCMTRPELPDHWSPGSAALHPET